MTKSEYSNAMGKLLRVNGGNENAPEVAALNNRYSTQLQVANAGGDMVSRSNQDSQGSLDQRHVAGLGLSQSQIRELEWANNRQAEMDALEQSADNVQAIKDEFGM